MDTRDRAMVVSAAHGGAGVSRSVVVGLALVGMVGSVGVLLIGFGLAVDWGPPGSASYRTYELVNRLLGVVLAATACSPVALRFALGAKPPGRTVRIGLWLASIGLVGMVLGSVAEFWLFSASPYQGAGSEGRTIAWIGFLLSGLLLIIGSMVAGIGILRGRVVPRWIGPVVLLAAPVGIAATYVGAPLFVAVPLISLAMGISGIVGPAAAAE